MAGHSKWANIKHRKAAADAKKGKVFTRLIKEITVAAKHGGGDPDTNPRLRLAMDKAREANMTNDSVKNAIKRDSGQLDGASYDEVRYEGYGTDNTAVMIDCLTDNRTRTVAEVRHAFSKNGGNLGSDGSVAYLFKHVGHEHRHAQVREPVGERLHGDGLAGAGRAGDQSVAIGQPGQERKLDFFVLRQKHA